MPVRRITATEAYEMAKSVQSSLTEHTSVCTERWNQSRIMLQEVRDEVRKLNKDSDQRAGAIQMGRVLVAGIAATIGAAITWFIDWHHR